MKGKVIIFSAPSGSGKSTVVSHLMSKCPELELSISATSRAPRGKEKDGVEYYFLSVEEFQRRIAADEFVEYEQVYNGVYYGTLKSELERIWGAGHIIAFDVDVKGGVHLKKIFGDDAISVFIKAPSVEALRERLIRRATDSQEAIAERVAKAVQEMEYAPQFDYVLVNDNLQTCLTEAEGLLDRYRKGQRRVALYFGTFNPMHAGHLAVLNYLRRKGFDEVRMIVSPESPFKTGSSRNAEERLADVRAKVAERCPDVIVSDIEFNLPKPNYTINTLRALQQAEPDTDFVIAMGADNMAGLEKWREWEEIVNNYQIWVYPRKGYYVKRLCKKLGARYLADAKLVNISSTQIRAGKANKELMI